jgi:DNA-binding CsgD family transcriptional regulator
VAGAGLGSLSRRERQVGLLVAERRTNAQIAAELSLSQKTIETHMRNVFFKLGVSSRADVARLVRAAQGDGMAGSGDQP